MILIKLRHAVEMYQKNRDCKITYEQLAQMTGLSKATIEALGSRADYNPTLSTIDRVCEALECELTELLEHQKSSEAVKRTKHWK